MHLKGFFANSSIVVQMLILISLVIMGGIISSLMVIIINAMSLSNIDTLRVIQLLSAVFLFLLPSIVFAWLCSWDVAKYLSLKPVTDAKVWFAVFATMLLMAPSINLIAYLNAQLHLPSFMSPIEEWMKSMESAANSLTESFFAQKGVMTLLLNLIVIALSAGITEEFFFRGALQRMLEKKITNHHTVIWIAAFIFGFIHFQFYGLLPRVLLGAYFGYLLYWSKSLWLPVFAHFTNNAVAVVGMSIPSMQDKSIVTGNILAGEMINYLIIIPPSLFLFYFGARYIYRNVNKAP